MTVKKSFDLRVYEAVSQIPLGQVATYGQIAELIGSYGCARQVGWSLKRLSLPSTIPWHRVINAKGKVSMKISREGTDWIQTDLLKHEGIFVDTQSKIPLSRYLWKPVEAVYEELSIEKASFKANN
ncbi:MGMT family protein [Prochlorococcus sp. MIT 1307]|uniref:MGMT family protein n=1 Tax=Prochlorococcus sp. MIT 1307 TaxID=3096219 RepID=UPI002A74F091|nr:MGMT family protein [Prochlorococcus sp. MIT 1307]